MQFGNTARGTDYLQRLTAFVVITEQKNDDAASEEASI